MTKSIEEIFQDIQSDFDVLCEKMEALKEQLKAKVENEKVNEKINVRWKPEKDTKYWYIDDLISWAYWADSVIDDIRFNYGNCYKTEKEAEQARDKMLIEQQLEDIATRLNNGVEIDWQNEEQGKYYISQNHNTHKLVMAASQTIQPAGIYFCLSNKFLETAIAEIGEEKLKFYMGVE